jgi:hypothetical protein
LRAPRSHYRAALHGYDLAAWAGFFTAVTGAAAALAGLPFVAVSINRQNIIEGSSAGGQTCRRNIADAAWGDDDARGDTRLSGPQYRH